MSLDCVCSFLYFIFAYEYKFLNPPVDFFFKCLRLNIQPTTFCNGLLVLSKSTFYSSIFMWVVYS